MRSSGRRSGLGGGQFPRNAATLGVSTRVCGCGASSIHRQIHLAAFNSATRILSVDFRNYLIHIHGCHNYDRFEGSGRWIREPKKHIRSTRPSHLYQWQSSLLFQDEGQSGECRALPGRARGRIGTRHRLFHVISRRLASVILSPNCSLHFPRKRTHISIAILSNTGLRICRKELNRFTSEATTTHAPKQSSNLAGTGPRPDSAGPTRVHSAFPDKTPE